MYSTHNEGKSVVAERFIRTWKSEVLVDEYNNNYHRSIGKKSIHADYSVLTEEIELSHKLLILNLVTESRLLKIRTFLAKVTQKIGRTKHMGLILCWNPWTFKIKDLNG